MATPVIEICVDTLDGARAAARGGADRIEFCSALAEGGLTPSLGLVELALESIQIPIHVMVRPRSGDFLYSPSEFASMERDIDRFKQAGVHGIVLGILLPDKRVDVARTRQLVERASPMAVTFHRAFDECSDLEQSLEDVITTGANMLLTSGGASSLRHGVGMVAKLVRLSGNRIEIIASAGVTIETAAGLWESTKSAAIHASLRREHLRRRANGQTDVEKTVSRKSVQLAPLEEDVRALVAQFHAANSQGSSGA